MNYDAQTVRLDDLASAFQKKTDDELLLLAVEIEQLTFEGQATLRGELSRRRLETPPHQQLAETQPPKRVQLASARERTMTRALGVSEFIAEVASTYRQHWWLFIKLVTPAVAIAYFAGILAIREGREISRHIPPVAAGAQYQTALFEIWLVRVCRYLVSWLAFSFAFAGICSAIRQSTESQPTPSAADCFIEVRDRIGPFLRLSLLLVFVLLGLIALSSLVSVGAFWICYRQNLAQGWIGQKIVWFLPPCLGLVVSARFGLAIPAFVWEGCGVGRAMFRSDELTVGQWLNLAALLAKTLVGGYVAGMMPFWLAAWFLTGVQVPWWFENALMLTSFAAVSVIEPMLFIGLALLYQKQSAMTPDKAHLSLAFGEATARSL